MAEGKPRGDARAATLSPDQGLQRLAFLGALHDALRPLSDAAEIEATACRLVGEHLDTQRALYAEIVDGDTAVVAREWLRDVASSIGRFELSRYGRVLDALREGQVLRIDDVATDPRLSPTQREAYATMQVGATLTASLVKGGRWVAALSLQCSAPRHWTPLEEAVLCDTAEGTWAAVERARVEEALRASEERFRLLGEGAPLIISLARSDGTLEYVNPYWERFSGLSAEAFVSGAWLEGVHPDDRDWMLEAWEQARATGTPYGYDLRARAADGSYRWLHAEGAPVPDPRGGQPYWVSVAADVHERHVAEQRQREAEEAERRARHRSELLAALVAEMETAVGVAACARVLVDAVVPALADEARVEQVDGRAPPMVLAARSEPPVLREGEDAMPVETVVPLGGAHEPLRLVLRWDDAAAREHLPEDRTFAQQLGSHTGVVLAAARVREEEQQVATALQRALLPSMGLNDPRVAVAARYDAAGARLEVGGDWHDYFALPDGRLVLSVGDVVGHGIEAAASMGRLRVALAAFAQLDPDPARVLDALDAFTTGPNGGGFATAFVLVLDPHTGQVQHASAGHPAALVVTPEGSTRWLRDGRGQPLGFRLGGPRVGAVDELEPGSMVVLYSDGLVERRNESLEDGLERLDRVAAGLGRTPVETACDHLVEQLSSRSPREDDVVVLCVRTPPLTVARFRHVFPGVANELRVVRHRLREWLGDLGLDPQPRLMLAVGEACSNAVEHGYGERGGELEVLVEQRENGRLLVSVRDEGTWKTPDSSGSSERGRGIGLIRRVAGDVHLVSSPAGTTITFSMGGP
jgi:PAS domain S-box-containing protein